MRRAILGIAAFVAIGILPCQAAPQQLPFDKTAAGTIKTIEIVPPWMPERPDVPIIGSIGRRLGMVSTLIDAKMQSNREDDFEAMMKAQNFEARGAFLHRLDEALTRAGYSLIHDSGARKQPPAHDVLEHNLDDFLAGYPATTADAQLDIIIRYGYRASGPSMPYQPYAVVNCKLVRGSDKAVLMQKSIYYNPLAGVPEQAIVIPMDTAYDFADFEALTRDPERAVKGLDVAIAQVASTMGTLLQ